MSAPGRRFGAGRVARPARRRPRLLHGRAAGPDPRSGAGWADAIWETGREFGTIGIQKNGLRLEITTFRAEAYDGVTRNPVVRYGSSLLDDLERRDFTINAMAVSLPGHAFTDPFGGLADLAARRDPHARRPGAVVRR